MCHGTAPLDAHRVMHCTNKHAGALQFRTRSRLRRCAVKPRRCSRFRDGTFPRLRRWLRGLVRERLLPSVPLCALGRSSAWRSHPDLPGSIAHQPLPSELRSTNPRPASAIPPRTNLPTTGRRAGTRQQDEQPPVIRRAEVVAFALVALLVIAIVAVLYVAKAFFLPVVMAFVVGTMLSPAAGFLERHHIPRAVSAVLIVTRGRRRGAFIVGLIASPVMEWSTRLPELGSLLRDKLHMFDRPLALWQQLQGMLGGSDTLRRFQMPKFEWVQPTIEFLSPTFTEFLLFLATLILFIASWTDLRRAMVMTFADRPRGCEPCGSSTKSRSISAAICSP